MILLLLSFVLIDNTFSEMTSLPFPVWYDQLYYFTHQEIGIIIWSDMIISYHTPPPHPVPPLLCWYELKLGKWKHTYMQRRVCKIHSIKKKGLQNPYIYVHHVMLLTFWQVLIPRDPDYNDFASIMKSLTAKAFN